MLIKIIQEAGCAACKGNTALHHLHNDDKIAKKIQVPKTSDKKKHRRT